MAGGFTGHDPSTGRASICRAAAAARSSSCAASVGTQFGARLRLSAFRPRQAEAHGRAAARVPLHSRRSTRRDLPVFDGIDRINERSLVTYGFATRLLGRSAADGGRRARRGVRARASVGWRRATTSSRDIPPTSLLDPVTGQPVNPGQGDHFSDIDFALRVNPEPDDVGARLRHLRHEREQPLVGDGRHAPARAGARLRTRRSGPRSADPRHASTVEYRFITDSILQLLDSSVALPITDRIAVALRDALRHQRRHLPGELHRRAAALVVRLLGAQPRRHRDAQPERGPGAGAVHPRPGSRRRPALPIAIAAVCQPPRLQRSLASAIEPDRDARDPPRRRVPRRAPSSPRWFGELDGAPTTERPGGLLLRAFGAVR